MKKRMIKVNALVFTDSQMEVEQILGDAVDLLKEKTGTYTSIIIEKKKERKRTKE
jgi:hypothetical protein